MCKGSEGREEIAGRGNEGERAGQRCFRVAGRLATAQPGTTRQAPSAASDRSSFKLHTCSQVARRAVRTLKLNLESNFEAIDLTPSRAMLAVLECTRER
jgi:hypothetical protein